MLLHNPLAGWIRRRQTRAPWPLKFSSYSFGFRCYNTLDCSCLFNRCQFGTRRLDFYGLYFDDDPSGPPPTSDWKKHWRGGHIVSSGYPGAPIFPTPVDLAWTSLEWKSHRLSLNLGRVFSNRHVLHNVQRTEVDEGWLHQMGKNAVSPDILLEVNNETLNLYMRAVVLTESEQIPGNRFSDARDDLVLAWTKTL